MAHLYEATHSNGQVYDVTTNHHHGDHTVENFKKILGDIVKQSAGGVVSGTILHFVFKGRK
jgi:hypothetical protein